MSSLVLKAYWNLISFDLYLARRDFSALYDRVRSHPLNQTAQKPYPTEQICRAADTASIWYWKEVLCLQRSAATVCLLKDYGVPAEMVIGTQLMPVKLHAWVEVNGRVVNDKGYMREMYTVLDRC
jgi:hypothetical protein